MDVFRWIAVVLSTVLGLGIARILAGYVAAFKARHQARPDWLPLLFAGVVLGEALQFWWALAELSGRGTWSLADFTILVVLVILLFLAAALIIPTDSEVANPGVVFERDGRWALLLLAFFHLMAIFADWWLFSQPVASFPMALIGILAALCLIGALVPRRRLQEIVALLYCGLTVISTFVESQGVYSAQ